MTNETIEAIVAGLDSKPTDTIRSICSDGEVPLALLEYVDRVIAFDKDTEALDEARLSIDLISRGQYDKFLEDVPLYTFNQEYFSIEGRLDRIRAKLGNLEIIEGDIFERESDPANKIYLSNALTFFGAVNGSVTDSLRKIIRFLPPGGLLYVSDGRKMRLEELGYRGMPEGLEVCPDLTEAAKRVEQFWDPKVFRRV